MTAPFVASSPSGFPVRSAGWASTIFWNTSGGALSARSARTVFFSLPSYTDYIESPVQTARTSGASGVSRSITTFASGNTLREWYNAGGTAVLRIQAIGTRQFQLQYWNGSGWTAVGAGGTITTGSLYRFTVEFSNLGNASTGALRFMIFRDSTDIVELDVSATGLNLSACTDIAKFRDYGTGSTIDTLTEAFLKDGSGASAYCYGSVPTAAGTDNTDGTGAYTAVDDGNVTNPDSDVISLPASGNKRSYKTAARNFSGRACKGVTREIRMRCGATGPTQVKPYLLIGGTRYYHASSPVTLTTIFVDYQFTWELDPSTGAAWAANAESANLEWGVEVV
ncbi:MAG: hypothetical protein KKA12_08585 [Alphaproteobacteria bacterium]|nr:hypothetical protein [Alphaproteobacteria bacterium]